MNQQLIAPHVAALLKRFAGGDSLVLRELIAMLSADQLAGRAFLPDPLPAPLALSAAIGWQNYDAADRRLILIATLCVTDSAAILLSAASVSMSSAFGGRTAELLKFGEGRFNIPDQRIRSVATRFATAAEHAEAHWALSRAFRADEQPHQSAWHAVLGDSHKLRDSSTSLIALAERRLKFGDFAAAFEIARAAAPALRGDMHSRARLLAAGAALWCGWTVDAEEQIQQVRVPGLREHAIQLQKIRRALDSLRDGPSESSRTEDRVLEDTRPLADIAMTRADRIAMNKVIELITVFRAGEPQEADEIQSRLLLSAVPARIRGPWGTATGALSPLAEAYVRVHEVGFQLEAKDFAGAGATLTKAMARLPMTSAAAGGLADVIRIIFRAGGPIDITIADTFDALAPRRQLMYDVFDSPAGNYTAAASIRNADGTSAFAPLPDPWSELLSPREHEVVHLVAQGHSNRQIAEMLTLSVRTVEVHLASSFRKLGVHSRTELVSRALKPSPYRST